MTENISATLELKEKRSEYLGKMADRYDLPDRSKTIRCLTTYAMEGNRTRGVYLHQHTVYKLLKAESRELQENRVYGKT